MKFDLINVEYVDHGDVAQYANLTIRIHPDNDEVGSEIRVNTELPLAEAKGMTHDQLKTAGIRAAAKRHTIIAATIHLFDLPE